MSSKAGTKPAQFSVVTGYFAEIPPSIIKSAPVTNLDSSEAR